MSTQIQLKRGTASDLATVNPTLAAGEPGYETDTGKFKIGDGTTAWTSLPYAALSDAPSDGGTYAREDGAWVDVAQAANLQLRRGTEAERVQITPLEGEPIYATDSKKLYIGDGSTVGGNEIVSGEKAPQQNPKGMIRLVTVSASGFSAGVRSTTGYVAVRWWDGSVGIFGNGGIPASTISVSKTIPTTGNWSFSAPKEVFIWSCASSSNATQSGDLTTFSIAGFSVTSLSARGLTALTALTVTFGSLTSLDVSGCPALTSLDCNTNSLTSLDVSGCTALTSLDCNTNSLTSLDVSGCTALTSLSCGANSLTSLDVSNLTALTSLTCGANSLTSLDVSNLTALTSLICNINSLTSLDVSNLTALTSLTCGTNSLTSLDVSGCLALTTLNCSINNISSLDVSNLTALTRLFCADNNISSLDVSNLTALDRLTCSNNNISSLDVSNLTALTRLICGGNNISSLRAVAVSLIVGTISENNLDAAALNQFYTDLAPRSGSLTVTDNPGTAADDPTIATAKGYTVLGS